MVRIDAMLASFPLFLVLLGFFIAGPGYAGDAASPGGNVVQPTPPHDSLDRILCDLPEGTRQAILVTGTTANVSLAMVYAYQRGQNGWTPAMGPFNAVVGRKGFAGTDEKREGDGKTPSGIYTLESTFGYAKAINTKMPYRRATHHDIWVDDVGSQDYNRWVRKGETDAVSFEEMRRKDDLYKYGIVIGYNTNPVIKGRGSAIFVHIWKSSDTPTSGCIATAEDDLLKILAWLDSVQKPVVIIRP